LFRDIVTALGADLFDSVPDPLLGRTLAGRYQVVGRLGEGGVGVVYRAKQEQLGRFVAIKVLHQDAAVIPEWRRRFEREARALSVLAHPNIVPVTDSGIDRGVPYLVMELLQGKTLGQLIKEGPLPLWRALDIARQTLRGLGFAHGKAIVHRDLKPANVFLQALPDQADHVRLLDFGMAKFLEGSSSRTMAENLTRVGVVFGTPAYMSPEQVKAAPVDARSDVYAAGVLLFELLAGQRPFNADSYEGYMGAHLTQPVPSLEKFRPGHASVPLLQPVVEKAMAKKPAARFKDAGAMLAALEAAIAKLPAGTKDGRAEARRKPTPRPQRHIEARARASVSRFLRRAILMGALAAGLAVAVVVYLRGNGASPVETTPVKTAALPAPPPPPKPAPPLPPAPPPEPVKPVLPAEPPPTSALPAAPSLPAPAPVAAELPPPPKPAPPKAPPSEAPPEADEPAGSAKAPDSRSRNPWKEPVPRVLKPIRDRVERGAKVSQRALRPVYAFAHENPDDPRPWLLLGHTYAENDWYSDSIERYVKAHSIDSTVRGDPQMLPDLLKAAVHPVAGRLAARTIRDIYGAEAIPELEKAMERRRDPEATARLAKLRQSLSR
jgi:eukaryotic-like serine/threonine-protein kinase